MVTLANGLAFNTGFTVTKGTAPVTNNLTMYLDANNPSSYPGSGSTWYDISGFGANISLVGNPIYTSGSPAYFTFNGSSQAGTGSTPNVLQPTQYTKSIWFYLNGYADNNLSSSAVGGHFIYMFSSNRIYCGHTDWPSYTAYPSVSTFALNTWYYVALTFNTTDGMTLYVNGVLDSTYTANKSAFTGNGSTNIATFNGTGNWLNGRISKAFFYDDSLTASEVLQNYNSTKAIFGY